MRSTPQLVLTFILSSALLGCIGVKGSITVEGMPVSFTSCVSGIHEGFLGADLISDRVTMRLIRTATKQSTIIVTGPYTTNELSEANCELIRVDAENTFYSDSAPGGSAGTAQFRCKTKAGGRVEGSVSFHCH